MTPQKFLRIEGLAILLVAVNLYFATGVSWWWFAALLILPDVSMAGYLKDSRLGALTYNLGHTYATPLVLMTVTTLLNWQPGYFIGLAWVAHIGLDRLFGYGLKHADGFTHTHLGRIGRPALDETDTDIASINTARTEQKEQNKQKILELFEIETKEQITNNDVEALLGVSDATATRYLQELEDERLVTQIGNGKNTYYIRTER